MIESVASAMREANVATMNKLEGFKVVIICCSSLLQAKYWQQRLEAGRGSVLPIDSVVLSVEEDWIGGAGNALGTLYAFQKAAKIAKELHNLDIERGLQSGSISVGLFHTAGKGTRLAPLPGSENNNKPGVKLPATIEIGGESVPMSILEAVIKQTGCYAKSRLGRLSVFWGDQVFIPTVSVEYTAAYHADILCSLGPMLTETEWKEKGMNKYGLIAQATGGAAQVEKLDHATAVRLLASLGEIISVGVSLGSFSISSLLLFALLAEFSTELSLKKNVTSEIAGAHFDRIASMMEKFHQNEATKSLGVFGPVDVGQGVYWWDYGQLRLYQQYALMMTDNTEESALMRTFFGIDNTDRFKNAESELVKVDSLSCISSSTLLAGSVTNCVISNVKCNYIQAEDCILINVTADRIIASKGSILYNIASKAEVQVVEGEVLVGVFAQDGTHERVYSSITTDGGDNWEKKLAPNMHSFAQIYNANTEVCPTALSEVISSAHSATWAEISQEKVSVSKKARTDS